MDIKQFFQTYKRLAIAFSGGVDSAYVAVLAKQYDADFALYYVKSAFQPQFELDDATAFAKSIGKSLTVIQNDVLSCDSICRNDAERCYHCKLSIFSVLVAKAREDGFTLIADGTNASDLEAERPGSKALKQLSVVSPLKLAGITKSQVREGLKNAGCFLWNKPSYSCLATRIQHGIRLESAILERVEKTETALFALGLTDFRVRVRSDGVTIELRAVDKESITQLTETILETTKGFFPNKTNYELSYVR